MQSGNSAAYVAFGEGLGWMQDPFTYQYELMDVHGAGCQRSDPKTGNPEDYPYGHGPQGDVIRIYNYVRLVRDAESTTGLIDDDNSSPSSYSLNQNYPNPFNPSTTISFTLPADSQVSLKIFNLIGQEIETLVSNDLSVGNYSYNWDAKNQSAGVYFYNLKTDDYSELKKMILLK
jgi:hypothetical protein